MKNVTVSLDEALVRRAKVEAAKQDKSLSKYIAELLARELDEGTGDSPYNAEYRAAMEAWRAQEPFLTKDPDTRWPKRQESYRTFDHIGSGQIQQ